MWIKVVRKGVYKPDALDDSTGTEILTEYHWNLIQPGCGPYLCIPETELMLAHAARGFEYDL